MFLFFPIQGDRGRYQGLLRLIVQSEAFLCSEGIEHLTHSLCWTRTATSRFPNPSYWSIPRFLTWAINNQLRANSGPIRTSENYQGSNQNYWEPTVVQSESTRNTSGPVWTYENHQWSNQNHWEPRVVQSEPLSTNSGPVRTIDTQYQSTNLPVHLFSFPTSGNTSHLIRTIIFQLEPNIIY